MRKVICLLMLLAFCLTLAVPVVAADSFVPSISYKDHPEVVEDPELVDPDGHKEKLDGDCLVITPVSKALDTPENQRNDAERLLIDVYNQLTDGSMKLPDGEDLVIRDLIDATLICGDYHTDPSHVEELAKEGVCIEITFDLGVEKDTKVVVMVYMDGQWVPAESVVNNGDGTVTCVFEEICPIVFCVEKGAEFESPDTGDHVRDDLMLWICLTAGCALLLVILLTVGLRKRSR